MIKQVVYKLMFIGVGQINEKIRSIKVNETTKL